MTAMKRTFSIILAVLMLLSAIPFTASAAILLDFSNTTIVPPTVTPAEFDYGTTYRDIKVEGGSLSYNGTVVEGYWGFEDWTLDVKPAVSDEYLMLSFIPADTSTYAVSMFYPSTDEQKALMPKIKVNALKASVDGELAVSQISVGDTLGTATITGKVVDKNGNEVSGGKWTWVSDGLKGGTSWKVLVEDEFSAQWKCTGYENIDVKIKVTPVQGSVPATGLVELPSIPDNLYYFEGMTLADIPLTGGKAVFEGKEISGHFEWSNPTRAVRPDRNANVNVNFVPDDAEIAAVWVNDNFRKSYYIPTAPEKKALTITKTPEQLTLTVGYSQKEALATALGFEFAEDIDASLVKIKLPDGINELKIGSHDAMSFTVYVDDDYGLYEEKTLSLPVNIIPRQDSGKFCFIDLTTSNSNNEGRLNVRFSYHSQDKNGTATIKLSDGTNEYVLAENVPPTYNPGESSKTKVFSYQIEEPGTYTFTATATYIPGEGDEVEFTNPVVSSYPVTITVKPWRTITAVNTKWESSTLQTYEGRQISISTNLSADKFGGWEIKDADGNIIAPETLGLTAEQMNNSSILFYMPDYDITVTAKEKGLLPGVDIGGGDDAGNEDGFLAKVKAFFEGLFDGETNCPVIKWFIKVFNTIVNFITGLFVK